MTYIFDIGPLKSGPNCLLPTQPRVAFAGARGRAGAVLTVPPTPMKGEAKMALPETVLCQTIVFISYFFRSLKLINDFNAVSCGQVPEDATA
jgi:hypothetical protein